MERMIEAIKRLMEKSIVNHNPPPMRNQDFREPLCGEKTQFVPRRLQEHTDPSLLVEEGEDKQLRPPLPPNLASHEE